MIRGPISMLIVGAVMLGVTLLVTLGPRAFEGILPAAVLDRLDGGLVGAFDGDGPAPGDTPADFLVDGPDGLEARGAIAALAGNRPVFIKDVVSGYTTRVSSDIPVEITKIRPISGCRLTPPLAGTVVGHVTGSGTEMTLPFLTYNDGDLAVAVQSFVNRYRETGQAAVTLPSGLGYSAYDVAVTETRSPVYLVLESAQGNRIWNIHLAPGARIERVILLGGTHAGVANLDPVVPVEVLPGAALQGCGIVPAYPLNPGHRFFEILANGAGSSKADAEAKFAAMQEAIAAYNTWFRDSFGIVADESRSGFDGGTIAVVGPAPLETEPKAVYAAIQGARIRMTQDAYFEVQGQAAQGEDFASRVLAIATSFAFGNVANLRQGVQY